MIAIVCEQGERRTLPHLLCFGVTSCTSVFYWSYRNGSDCNWFRQPSCRRSLLFAVRQLHFCWLYENTVALTHRTITCCITHQKLFCSSDSGLRVHHMQQPGTTRRRRRYPWPSLPATTVFFCPPITPVQLWCKVMVCSDLGHSLANIQSCSWGDYS